MPKIIEAVIGSFSGRTAKYTWTTTSAIRLMPAKPGKLFGGVFGGTSIYWVWHAAIPQVGSQELDAHNSYTFTGSVNSKIFKRTVQQC